MSGSRQRMARIEAQAADWFARSEAGLSELDRKNFDAWIAADTRHRVAYLRVSYAAKRADELLPRVRDAWEAGLELRSSGGSGTATPFLPRFLEALHGWPRQAAATLAVVTLLFALGFYGLPASGLLTNSYSAPHSDARPVTLKDGSVAWLNADAEVRWLFSWNDRRVELVSGAAVFDVVPDKKHPFWVLLDSTRIRVVGTKFNVDRKSSGAAVVSVIEGTVEVHRDGSADKAPSRTWVLHVGEQLELTSSGVPNEPHTVAPDTVAPWRGGSYTFEYEPLENVFAELRRYTARRIDVQGDCLVGEHYTGKLSTRDVGKALQHVQEIIPVTLSTDEHSFTLTCRDREQQPNPRDQQPNR